MKYRALGKTGLQVSEIGLGAEHVTFEGYDEIERVLDRCCEAGVNYIDFFMAAPEVRSQFGRAMKGRQKDIILAVHMGSIWDGEQYQWSRDYPVCVSYIEDSFRRLSIDAIDILVLHLVDDMEDFNALMGDKNFFEYALRLKRQGRAKHIGISTHSVAVAAAAADCGQLDILEFPVNPIFDAFEGDFHFEDMFLEETYRGMRNAAAEKERIRLYRYCEQKGMPITAIKLFAGGPLLQPGNFSGLTLTPVQAVAYALSRPAVSTVLPGVKNVYELDQVLKYFDADDAEKDFSVINASEHWDFTGQCTYCNHCLPCPSRIDIGGVTRILDSGRIYMSDDLKKAYAGLKVQPDQCIKCGECVKRCPFGADPTVNMAACAAMFQTGL